MKVYTIGHINPDLDTVASSKSYAEFLAKAKRYPETDIISLHAGGINQETEYIFNKFSLELPTDIHNVKIEENDKFILVDHNEESQRADGIDPARIIEIVDHHKLNINFTTPIRVDVRPLGSTCSIIYELFQSSYLEPEPEIEKIILASILSDTVGLKSSLTTGIDVTITNEIAKKYSIDIEKLTFEIFKVKSDIKGLSPIEIVNKDAKIFDFGGNKVFIGEVETVEPEKDLEQKDKLIQALEEIKAKKTLGIAYLFVIDILKLNAKAIYATETEKRILEEAFTSAGENGVIDVGPRISRKKDIAPAIEAVVTGKLPYVRV